MESYKKKPLVIRQFFDDDTYATIRTFMVDYLPLIPVRSDSTEPDGPSKFGRRYANNLPFFRTIHNQLGEYASDIFGEKVIPSYSFLSLYNPGGRCPLHIDRPQCRYTIDYLIRQDSKEPWPIAIGPQMTDSELSLISEAHPKTSEQTQSVIDSVDWTVCNLLPNDAVCYSGTHSWHYRPEPSTGSADLVFFHFVPANFKGDLD